MGDGMGGIFTGGLTEFKKGVFVTLGVVLALLLVGLLLRGLGHK